MAVNVAQLQFLAESDQIAALAEDLRARVAPDLWEDIQRFACGMVTSVRLAAEMHQAEDYGRAAQRYQQYSARMLRRPQGLCCALRQDGAPCRSTARYRNDDDGSLTCGNHKQRTRWVEQAQP